MRKLFLRPQRGSMSIEAVIITPIVVLFILFAVACGRFGLAQQAVQNAANAASRDASLARSSTDADSQARAGAQGSMSSQNVKCAAMGINVDASGIDAPLGTIGTVRATVSCDVSFADIAFPGLPGSIHVERSATSPVDPYRERS
jgi:Flp pilus assembly protein TadG